MKTKNQMVFAKQELKMRGQIGGAWRDNFWKSRSKSKVCGVRKPMPLTNFHLRTEDDIRTKIVSSWLAGHGIDATNIHIEPTFSIRLGRSVVRVKNGTIERVNGLLQTNQSDQGALFH